MKVLTEVAKFASQGFNTAIFQIGCFKLKPVNGSSKVPDYNPCPRWPCYSRIKTNIIQIEAILPSYFGQFKNWSVTETMN